VAEEPGDAALVRATLAGDARSFDRLVRRYSRRVLAVAWEFTDTRDDAEDVVQETFFRALRSLESYDPRRPFAPWLFTILRNVARNAAAARGRWRFVPVPDELPSSDEDPDRALDRRDALARVEDALERLSPMQRACFRLCEGEGYRSAEVGTMLGVSEATVRVHLHRARRALDVLIRSPSTEAPRDA
jgi:RNA polymerase sigma-70 factor (ECF subfamily)